MPSKLPTFAKCFGATYCFIFVIMVGISLILVHLSSDAMAKNTYGMMSVIVLFCVAPVVSLIVGALGVIRLAVKNR